MYSLEFFNSEIKRITRKVPHQSSNYIKNIRLMPETGTKVNK